MATLTTLPPEILQNIFSEFVYPNPPGPEYFPKTFYKHTLVPASKTCRRLNDAVEPLLYKHVIIDINHANAQRLLALLRHWDSRPHSATYVRTIRVGWHRLYRGALVISDDDAEFLALLARRLGLSLPDDWCRGKRATAIMAGLVILQAINVRAIDFQGFCFEFYRSISPQECPRLESLTHVSINLRHAPRDGMSEMHRFLALAPRICAINLNNVAVECGINWSNVSYLNFRTNNLGAEDLSRIIRACRSLKSFGFYGHEEHYTNVPDPSLLVEALSHHRRTLTRLTLESSVEDLLLHDDVPEVHNKVTSLAAFEKLESLRLTSDCFEPGTTLRKLPRSLRNLTLYKGLDDLHEDFESFVVQVESRSFPDLQEVILSGTLEHDHDGRRCPFMKDGPLRLEDIECLPLPDLPEIGSGGFLLLLNVVRLLRAGIAVNFSSDHL